ncbi:hypothetical protein CPC08DRAFT_708585 [Agrocybe pediades]|nr:hypothetical protein CPC08DRAFT_708585 [Agrocybe pediades]
MTWLDGVPRRVRPIEWAPEAETFRQRAIKGYLRLSRTCIFDDLICTFMAFQSKNGESETAVYLGDIRTAGDSVVMEQIALIPMYLVDVRLLPRDESRERRFVTLQAQLEESQMVFRLHARDGSVLKQQSGKASAPFGQLTVQGDLIAICVSSGDEPEDEPEYFASDAITQHRTDYTNFSKTRPMPGYPDSILAWNIEKDILHEVYVPQHADFLMLHQGDFGFVSPDRIALAGMVERSVSDVQAALLKCFSIAEDDEDDLPMTISQPPDMNAEVGQIYRSTGKPGSSEPSNIFLHYIASSGRLSVLHKNLLSRRLKRKKERDTLVKAIDNLSFQRAFHARLVSEFLPSISGNRALIHGSLISEEFQDPRLFLLDFDPDRVKNLLSLDESGRKDLEERLKAKNAAVKVMTRRVILWPEGAGDDEDAEYPYESRPEHWRTHLDNLQKAVMERDGKVPTLEYDEAPEEHRDQKLFGCSASVVQLPANASGRFENLGLTTSAIVQIGYPPITNGFGESWRVFEFAEEEYTY